MVALDIGRAVTAAGLDDIRIQGALHEVLHFGAVLAGFFNDLTLGLLESTDELLADDLALAFRLRHTLERGEEVLGSVDGDELDAGRLDEIMLDLLGLALAQQAMVHEHAGQLVADRLVHESGGNSGIHAAG